MSWVAIHSDVMVILDTIESVVNPEIGLIENEARIWYVS